MIPSLLLQVAPIGVPFLLHFPTEVYARIALRPGSPEALPQVGFPKRCEKLKRHISAGVAVWLWFSPSTVVHYVAERCGSFFIIPCYASVFHVCLSVCLLDKQTDKRDKLTEDHEKSTGDTDWIYSVELVLVSLSFYIHTLSLTYKLVVLMLASASLPYLVKFLLLSLFSVLFNCDTSCKLL